MRTSESEPARNTFRHTGRSYVSILTVHVPVERAQKIILGAGADEMVGVSTVAVHEEFDFAFAPPRSQAVQPHGQGGAHILSLFQ